MFCPSFVSKHIFYPLWDIYDRSQKLKQLQFLQDHQWQDKSTIEAYQWQRTQAMIDYAYAHSPFYKKRFDEAGIKPSDIKTRQDLHKIPVTRKSDIRNQQADFVSDDYQQDRLVKAKTGGSTGFSLELYFDEGCQEFRNAAALRSDQWTGWELGDIRGELWGNPPVASSFKEKVRLQLLDRVFYLDTMAMNHDSMSSFKALCVREGIEVLFGHAHSIYIYAAFLEDNDIVAPPLKGIIATSMMLLDHERQVIERVFKCKVTNRYGCEEVGLIASECEEHSGMHINAEHVLVEFLREDGTAADEGELAKIVVTDLNNKGMPLLRYQIEDMGSYSTQMCACGRGLPILKEINGRTADFLKTKSGDSVAGISLIERTLTDIAGIEQMQLVQDDLDVLVVNRVKGQGFSEQADKQLIIALAEVFGDDVDININDVAEIPQMSNGKYRFSICNL